VVLLESAAAPKKKVDDALLELGEAAVQEDVRRVGALVRLARRVDRAFLRDCAAEPVAAGIVSRLVDGQKEVPRRRQARVRLAHRHALRRPAAERVQVGAREADQSETRRRALLDGQVRREHREIGDEADRILGLRRVVGLAAAAQRVERAERRVLGEPLECVHVR